MMKRIFLTLAFFVTVSGSSAFASPLLDAIHDGNLGEAVQLVRDGADVNVAEANGTTALHWAIYNSHPPLIETLIAAGADVNAINDYGSTPMSEAATLGDYDIVKALLDAGADVNSPNADNQTALMIVVRSDNLDTAMLLIERGADVNATENYQGQNALIFATAQSQPDMVKLLLENGADPDSRAPANERDRQVTAERRFQWRPAGGLTALAYAAREGCLDCARLLVEAGADIDLGDVENVTPLNLAIMNLRFDTAKYLIESGANVDKWSLRGENPVYSAVDVNTLPHGGYPDRPSTDMTTSLEILEILLDTGANPNLQLKLQPTYRSLKDDRGADRMLNIGATPLLRAAKGHDVEAIKLLLAHGAHVDLPNREGTTPLMAAAGLNASSIDTRGDYTTPLAGQYAKETVALLLANGADMDKADKFGRTALHGAATWGWNPVIQYLYEAGANILAEDNNGLAPLNYAMGERSGGGGRGGSGDIRPETADLIQELLLQ
jgi:ankyrin repeat protein